MLEKKVKEIFKLWQEYPGAGGQVLVLRNGETVLEQCFGYADIEKKIPITTDSIFHVASVTKQVTAMCIVILHDRGLLDINDDIRKYIPDLVRFAQSVTVSNLLHHTSGMRESYELWRLHKKAGQPLLNQENLTAMVARQTELNFEPGTDFVYCNAGYLLLTHIVQRVSGMPFCEFARKNIFEPLGMKNTGFRLSPDMEIPELVTSYYDDGYQYITAESGNYSYGSGGMLSNCRDLMKLMPQYKDPTLISRETLENIFLHIPPLQDGTVTNYACGLRIDDLGGYRIIQHGGVTAGYRSVIAVVPEQDLMIAVCANTHNIPITTAGKDIARAALGLPDRKAVTLDRGSEKPVTEEIAGTYCHEGSGRIFCVRVEDGEVRLKLEHLDKWVALKHMGGNSYKMGRRNVTFAFGENPAVNNDEELLPLRKFTQKPDPAAVAEYAGTYYSEAVDGWLAVVWEQERLWLIRNSERKFLLHPVEKETFAYGSMENKSHVRFTRGNDGKVAGLVHMTNQIRSMPYVKTE